jgi:hypothetical protein
MNTVNRRTTQFFFEESPHRSALLSPAQNILGCFLAKRQALALMVSLTCRCCLVKIFKIYNCCHTEYESEMVNR